MLSRKTVIYTLVSIILLSSVLSCSAAKDVEERQNFMIPKKSEMMRNSRYKEIDKRKTNNYKPVKSKNRKLF